MSVESFSVEAEDLIIYRLLTALDIKKYDETGFFIDIGAYHPVRASNSYFFYRRGWRGVNVEPNPQFIPDFRRERPDDVTVNVGLSDVASQLQYHSFENGVLNGFYDQSVLNHHIGRGEKYLGSTPVQCMATQHFLNEFAARPIDVLNLDVENHEPQVLNAWDWVGRRPKVICVEIHATTMDKVAKSWVAEYLAGRGYVMMSRVWQSAVFVDARLLAPRT